MGTSMTDKPTYEELERRVKELEQENLGLKKKSTMGAAKAASIEINPEIITEEHLKNVDLQSIIDIDAIQSIMDDFHYLTNMVTAVLDINGNVLEATGWQDICSQFHRKNPQTANNCTASDLHLSKNLKPGEYVDYKCKNGLWDVVTPLYVGTKYLGNIYTGQFFYDDDQIDEDFFAKQADIYGFDKKSYLDALRRVPRYNRETISHLMSFLTKLTAYISRISLANIQLEEEIRGRNHTEQALRRSEERYRLLADNVTDNIWVLQLSDLHMLYTSPSVKQLLGYSPDEITEMPLSGYLTPESFEKVSNEISKELEKEGTENVDPDRSSVLQMEQIKKDGSTVWTEITARFLRDNNGQVDRILGITRDLTERKMAEIKLQESEDRFRRLFENAPLGYQSLDENGDMIEVNETWCKLLGYTKDEVIGKNFSKFIHPDFKDVFQENFPKFKSLGYTLGIEFEMVKKDGSEVIVTSDGKIAYEDDGSFKQTHCVLNDITESKLAVEALRESERRYRELVQNANSAIIRYQTDGAITFFNEYAQKFFGYSPEEAIGKHIGILLPEQESSGKDLTRLVQGIIEHPHRYINSINENICSDGRRVWMNWTNRPILDPNGQLAEILTVGSDITTRKKAEDALLEGRARLEGALESMSDAVFISDTEGRFIEFNEAFAAFHRFENKRSCLKSIADYPKILDVSLPDGTPVPIEMWVVNRALRGETDTNAEYRLKRKDTGETWLGSYNFAPIRNKENVIVGSVVACRDITENRKLLDQLHQAQKMESIGNLAGGIAHDFNNILSSIIGFTELALDDAAKGSTIEDSLQEIFTAGKRARDLVKQILAFSRQSEGEIKPLQVDTIAKEVLKFIRSTIPTAITIKQNINNDSVTMGNPTQIHQIIMNLCTNAAQAMEDRGGILEVNLNDVVMDNDSNMEAKGLKPGSYLELTISDTGAGIAPEIIDKIFEPYFTTKEQGKGTGMGLAMVHGIVENYGGKVTVNSTPGQGTLFAVYLPVIRKHGEQRTYEPEFLPTGTERILFVDDEAPLAKMGGQVLERLGYSVTTRTNSIEALELFRAEPNDFDLVISDVTMPNMTGDELAIEMMKIRPDIPLILCSGYSKKISDESATHIGIKAFVCKPIVKADFAKTVRKVLDAAKGETQE
jgi:PAS domain S-box-containing protein